MLKAWTAWGRPGWIKVSSFCSTKGDTVGGRQESCRPLTPDVGKLQQESWGGITAHPQSSHLHAAQSPTMSPSPACLKDFMDRHHGDLAICFVTPLSKTSTLVPMLPTPHVDYLLQHHCLCWSRLMLCSWCTSQKEH